MASLEADNSLVFYYLSAFEIWPYKMGGLSFEGDNQLVLIIIYWGNKIICCGNKISFLWEQNNKLWEQDIILREHCLNQSPSSIPTVLILISIMYSQPTVDTSSSRKQYYDWQSISSFSLKLKLFIRCIKSTNLTCRINVVFMPWCSHGKPNCQIS
jgi:hypothetical protein